jgi:maltose O-acetyltransferase
VPGRRADARPTSGHGLRRSLLARIRGEQTLARLRRHGLQSQPSLQLAAEGAIDARFAWAIEIGPDSIIASGVRIIAHDAAIKRLTGYTEVRRVVIGARCYIGAGAIVLPGAVIGNGAIIGAGAVVRGEIPPETLAVGNPAKVIGEVGDLRDRHLALMAATASFDIYPKWYSSAQLVELRAELMKHGCVYVR